MTKAMLSNYTLFIENFKSALYVLGLFSWGYLTFVLMEVTICKDARQVNTQKLLNRPWAVRWDIFKRSLRKLFYRASVGMLTASFLITMLLIDQLWNNLPKQFYMIIFHCVCPMSLIYLYKSMGHRVTFFVKFGLFLKGQE